MAVLYKSFQSVLEDKNHKKMFHPRVIYTANISTSQIAKEIAAYSSLSPGDVKNTLDNLVTVMGQHLQASESVSLDGFGTFRMVMKSNGKGGGDFGRSVGCASFSYGPFPSQLHQEPRSDYRYPLFGDRCEVCALRPYRHSGFRQWKYK